MLRIFRLNLLKKININTNKPPLFQYNIIKPNFSIYRTCSNENDKKYIPLYNMKYMPYVAMTIKSKKFVGKFSLIISPLAGILEITSLLPPQTFLTVVFSGLYITGLLTVISWFLSDMVGIVYISEDCSQLKVSVIDFWGNRKDNIMSLNDWVPFSDQVQNKFTSTLYQTAKTYDKDIGKMLIFDQFILKKKEFNEFLN